jgi:hypothetical protein
MSPIQYCHLSSQLVFVLFANLEALISCAHFANRTYSFRARSDGPHLESVITGQALFPAILPNWHDRDFASLLAMPSNAQLYIAAHLS